MSASPTLSPMAIQCSWDAMQNTRHTRIKYMAAWVNGLSSPFANVLNSSTTALANNTLCPPSKPDMMGYARMCILRYGAYAADQGPAVAFNLRANLTKK